jgi:hypothetical protein
MDSTQYTVHNNGRRRVCTADARDSDTIFQYPFPREGDKTQLAAIEVVTAQPPPPLDTILRDLGTLSVTANSHTVLALPVSLLAALGSVHYAGTELSITGVLSTFIRYFPMSAFQWSSPFVTIRVGSRRYIQSVRFVFDYKGYTELGFRRHRSGNFNSPIQKILTQTRHSPIPTTQFVFPMHLSQPTKGFFLEGIPARVYLVDASGERCLREAEHIGDYVFVPVTPAADIRTLDIESYLNTHETVYLKVVFAEPRTYASVHCLYRSILVLRSGLLQPFASASNGELTQSPRWWPDVVKPLDAARTECPITYDRIGTTYYECEGCQYAFSAAAFCSYASTMDATALICPMCRRPWSSCVQYQQM